VSLMSWNILDNNNKDVNIYYATIPLGGPLDQCYPIDYSAKTECSIMFLGLF
jgi:hypothetical protein